ncbi:hypothetical protein Tsubulata_039602 [Turnera subulata]|uniref:WIT1/2 N-terminal helical bundle domain-containing protein n=1 Tax=Turnera subulata TaxID=218843 RepID=A0A9Q0J3C8_9ROSI|nr:hypothetical protein Tsubulata_039602 [Turnera subulata]
MTTDAVCEPSVPPDDVYISDPEDASKIVEASSDGDTNGDLGSVGEMLLRVELDLTCVSEKLVNLSVLTMHVATKETDFEAFGSARGDVSVASAQKALEFVLLSGILDSQVTELNKFLTNVQADVFKLSEVLSSYEHTGETFLAVEEKLRDCEKLLEQSRDQVSEIRDQSGEFHGTLSFLDGKTHWKVDDKSKLLEDDQCSDMNAKIKMQTAEQQRGILRMLEKSLAKEIDLDLKLSESRQIEEDLSRRIHCLEQELFFIEEETTDVYENCFRAENAAEVLTGISKELLSRLQILQFNLNGSIQRETELRSKLEKSVVALEAKEHALQKFDSSSAKLSDFFIAQTDVLKTRLAEAEDKLILADSEAFTLQEKVSSLEKQLKEYGLELLDGKPSADGSLEEDNACLTQVTEMENSILELKEKLYKAENRAENAEAKCKLLEETNTEIIEELGQLKDVSQKADGLEAQLKEADIRLQHAVATAEASQEKENMLYSTIRDMENVIVDLKSQVSKAESRADSTEDKCIILSESNAELNEELVFLRSRLECLEASLNQAEETKMATVKDIGCRTKVITELVMQLAIERERLHKQISSLTLVNRALSVQLHQTRKEASVVNHHNHEVTQVPATGSEAQRNEFAGETGVSSTDLARESGRLRRIDVGALKPKHFFMAVLAVLISAAIYYCQPQNTAT